MALKITRESRLSNGYNTRIGTWNIQGGLRTQYNMELLSEDMEKYKVQIACLQETHCENSNYTTDSNGHIICYGGLNENKHKRYGMGFYYSKHWADSFYGTKYISDRICIIQFLLNPASARLSMLTIINVYGPTSQLALLDDLELASFYSKLHETMQHYKNNSTILMVAGDFNAKIGSKVSTGDRFMGN